MEAKMTMRNGFGVLGFEELNENEMMWVAGGLNLAVVVGGCIAMGLGVVAVATSAIVGAVVGGPAGAVAAAVACGKVVTPLVISGAATVCIGCMN